jgi:hypothetical protein
MRRIAESITAAVIILAALSLCTPSASAHGALGNEEPPSSNWRSRVVTFDSPVPGVSAGTVDAGERVEVVNDTAHVVTVFGYQNDPYLELRPDGVYENVRSPATYLNRSTDGSTQVPDLADPAAPAEWRRVTTANRVSWHDHRAHWMGGDPPPSVLASPDTEHTVIERWSIPLLADGHPAEIVGDLTWLPPPNPGPWLLIVLLIAANLAFAAFTQRWVFIARVATVAIALGVAVDVYGTWIYSGEPTVTRVADLLGPMLALSFLMTGATMLNRRRNDALLLLMGGAVGITILFGWLSRGFLFNAYLPTALPPDLARATVAVALGGGVGLFTLALSRWRGWAPRRAGSGLPRAFGTSRDRRVLVFGCCATAALLLGTVVTVMATGSRTEDSGLPRKTPDVSASLCASKRNCSTPIGNLPLDCGSSTPSPRSSTRRPTQPPAAEGKNLRANRTPTIPSASPSIYRPKH